jgi:hypothetical protein
VISFFIIKGGTLSETSLLTLILWKSGSKTCDDYDNEDNVSTQNALSTFRNSCYTFLHKHLQFVHHSVYISTVDNGYAAARCVLHIHIYIAFITKHCCRSCCRRRVSMKQLPRTTHSAAEADLPTRWQDEIHVTRSIINR